MRPFTPTATGPATTPAMNVQAMHDTVHVRYQDRDGRHVDVRPYDVLVALTDAQREYVRDVILEAASAHRDPAAIADQAVTRLTGAPARTPERLDRT